MTTNNDYIHVFITGSTGTVGQQILKHLNTTETTDNYIIHDFIRNNNQIQKTEKKISCDTFKGLKIINKKFAKHNKYSIGQDGLENSLYIEKKILKIVKEIAGNDNPILTVVDYILYFISIIMILINKYKTTETTKTTEPTETTKPTETTIIKEKIFKDIKNKVSEINNNKDIKIYLHNLNIDTITSANIDDVKNNLEKIYKKLILVSIIFNKKPFNDSNVENQYDNNKKIVEDLLLLEPDIQYSQNKNKKYKYIFINCAADKDANSVRANMKKNNITDVRKHWSINFASQLSKVTNYHFIKLIHLSTVYVNKGLTPNSGWAPTKLVLGDPPPIDNDYIYGYAKAYAENVIIANDPCATIIRLPGVYDDTINAPDLKKYYLLPEMLKELMQTSPTMVIRNLLLYNRLLEYAPNSGPIKKDDQDPSYIIPYTVCNAQIRYPVSATQIAFFIEDYIKYVKNASINEHTVNIINFCGLASITKFALATKFQESYNMYRPIIPLTTTTFIAVPESEYMIMSKDALPFFYRDQFLQGIYPPSSDITNGSLIINEDNESKFATYIKDKTINNEILLKKIIDSIKTIIPEKFIKNLSEGNFVGIETPNPTGQPSTPIPLPKLVTQPSDRPVELNGKLY